LEESARIDGANNFRILFSIMSPIAMPGIATIFLFNVLTYWNDWWLGLMLINGNRILPLQLFLLRVMQKLDFVKQSVKGSHFAAGGVTPVETVRMAICILVIGPIIFVYPLFQKYIVRGLLVGSIKG
jgi:putative aldouronate transport system permease protein